MEDQGSVNSTMDPNSTICCSDVPAALLNKETAKTYFQKFGRVKKIVLKPKRDRCVIEYDNSENARQAFEESGFFDGKPFKVAWFEKEHTKRERKRNDPDPEWTSDPDVKAELEAMRSIFSGNRSYTLRSEVMSVDPIPNPPKTHSSKEPKKVRSWRPEKPVKKKSNEQGMPLLESIMKSNHSSEEKYRVLDARDKLIRLKFSRQSSLATVVRTVGTCPDMCPEKERLMREAQHQVAVYEQLIPGKNNKMNHAIGVKQYSRSSADQEVPLAHELRPVSVLELTMGYLLHSIMDLCDTRDVNLGEWYHFLWDRMRGIRKDITQQELCCQGSVKLVEQCARFHIHCSARLVSEDVSVFDQKINTENLTKCLQTLKYMYHDLSLKNERCPNEAEFRGYIVLLNLNDGNFMWEVQQLSPEIQQSTPIKFALQVYSALDKNNYVRFFKLVHSTTYLNACILLRYFNQVRIRALTRIIKSYSPRQLHTHFPITELHTILAFEDVENTIVFLEHYGLQLNPEKTHVVLDRKMFHQPDLSFFLERATNVIESKRTCSVGEIVCGERLPEKDYMNHVPHNSFDEQGYLKLSEIPKKWQTEYQKYLSNRTFEDEAELSMDEEQMEDLPDIPDKPFTFSDPDSTGLEIKKNDVPVSPTFKFQLPTIIPKDDDHVKTLFTSRAPSKSVMSGNIFGSVPKAEVVKPFWSPPPVQTVPISVVNISQAPSVDFTTSLKTVTPPATFTIPMSFGSIGDFAFKKPDVPIATTTANFTFNIKKPEPPIVVEQKQEVVVPVSTPQEIEREAAKKRIEEAEKQRLKRMEEDNMRRAHELRLKEMDERRKEQERKLQMIQDVEDVLDFILVKVDATIEKERILKALSQKLRNHKMLMFVKKWRDSIKLSKRKRKHFFDSPTWVSSRSVTQEADELSVPSQHRTLQDIKRYKLGISQDVKPRKNYTVNALNTFNVAWKILYESLNTRSDKISLDIYWKVGVSLPEVSESSVALHSLESDLRTLFKWAGTNSTLSKFSALNGGTFSSCIQEIRDFQFMDTYNGIIFFEIGHITDKTRERLTHISKSIMKHKRRSLPLTVVIKNRKECKESIESKLNLRQLVSNGCVSDYNICFIADDIEVKVSASLKWLAQNVIPPPQVEVDALSTIVQNCVSLELWHRLESSCHINERLNILLQSPSIVVELHNEALRRLTDILCDPALMDCPRFPNEFKELMDASFVPLPCTCEYFPDNWNDTKHLQKIQTVLRSLELPKFNETWPPTDPNQFEEVLKHYCSKLFDDPENVTLKIISSVFKQSEYDFDRISWLDIQQSIVDEKIHNLSFYDDNKTYLLCGYNLESMNKFRQFPWWFHWTFIAERIKSVVVKDASESVDVVEYYSDDEEMDLDEIFARLYDDDNTAKPDSSKDVLEMSAVINDLEMSMKIQKNIISRLRQTTQFLINEN